MNENSPEATELMERIRLERHAHRRNGNVHAEAPRVELPVPAGPLPALPQPSPEAIAGGQSAGTVPIWEALTDMAARARSKITVDTWLPAFLRPLARNQGGYNGIMLEAIERVGESQRELQEGTLEQMRERMQEQIDTLRADLRAQNAWLQNVLRAREADLAWMRAVEPYLQRGLEQSEVHRRRAEQGETHVALRLAEADEKNDYIRHDLDQLAVRAGYHETHAGGLDERLSRLQSQADEYTGRLREQTEREKNTSAQGDRLSQRLADLQRNVEKREAPFTLLQERVEQLLQRVDRFGDLPGDLERLVSSQSQQNEQIAKHLVLLGRLLQRQLEPAQDQTGSLPPDAPAPGEDTRQQ